MDWVKTIARWDEKHLSFEIWCDLYKRFYGTFLVWNINQYWYNPLVCCFIFYLEINMLNNWYSQWLYYLSWWHHQMETISALLAICAGNSPATGEFPAQRPVTWSFDVFFTLPLNKRLSKQSWGWRFEKPSCSLWRHCNVQGVSQGSLLCWCILVAVR